MPQAMLGHGNAQVGNAPGNARPAMVRGALDVDHGGHV